MKKCLPFMHNWQGILGIRGAFDGNMPKFLDTPYFAYECSKCEKRKAPFTFQKHPQWLKDFVAGKNWPKGFPYSQYGT